MEILELSMGFVKGIQFVQHAKVFVPDVSNLFFVFASGVKRTEQVEVLNACQTSFAEVSHIPVKIVFRDQCDRVGPQVFVDRFHVVSINSHEIAARLVNLVADVVDEFTVATIILAAEEGTNCKDNNEKNDETNVHQQLIT